MPILLSVIPAPTFGGAANQTMRLRRSLEQHGWETVAVLPAEPGNAADRLRDDGVEVATCPMHRLRASLDPRSHAKLAGSFAREVAMLRALTRRYGAELVQTHGDLNPHGGIAGHREGAAVVWQLLDTRTPAMLRRVTMPLVTRLADVVTTTGIEVGRLHPGVLELGERHFPIVPPVSADEFRPDEAVRTRAREELGVPPGAVLVGAVGNRNPQKGHDWLVRAAAQARGVDPRIVVRILGARSPGHDAYERRLHATAASAGLAGNGAFAAIDPGRRVAELMPALDVLVVSSVPRSEGIPTVLLEAMSCAIPVVTTRVGAAAEVVAEGETGHVVDPLDADELAARLVALARDRERRVRMGREGRRVVLARYTVERCASRYVEAFEAAVAHRRARSPGPR